MRRRTAAAAVALVALLGALVAVGVGPAAPGGTLAERWVSDTARDNEVNHHAVGVGPADDVVVVPVAEVAQGDVTVTDTSCALVRLAPRNGSVLWLDGMPPEDCFTHALTEPAVADLDGDGTLAVAVASTEGALVVHDARDGREAFRVPLETYGYGRPTVADLDPAPGREVVVSDIDGHVVAARADGSVAWRAALDEAFGGNLSVWVAPAVTDVDADGHPEVVVGTNRGTAVLSSAGRVERAWDADAAYLAVGDVDDDPAGEVFVADTGAVRAFDGATGGREWGRDFRGTARLRTVADADGDGTAELFVGRSNGDVLALDATTGATEWSTTVSTAESPLPSPVLGDVNGDGRPEVVVASNGGTVAVLDAGTGAELAAYERDVPVWTFPTPADLDDDGRAEVLVRYGDGRVVALGYRS